MYNNVPKNDYNYLGPSEPKILNLSLFYKIQV